MKRVFGCALLVMAGSAGAHLSALASNIDAQSAVAARQFFLAASAAPVAQGYFGVDVRDVSPDQVGPLKLRDTRGDEIVLVDHDAPAGRAGLREHDVILQMNGQVVQGQDHIRRMLRECAPGRSIQLLISRNGQQITVTSQMSSREEVERSAWEQHLNIPEQPSAYDTAEDTSAPQPASSPAVHDAKSFIGSISVNPSYTGAVLENLTTQLADFFGVPSGTGLLVRSVIPNSPASNAGMRAGDVVVRANDKPVTSTTEWAKLLKSSRGKPVAVLILRDKKEQTITLTPDSKKRSALEKPVTEPSRNPEVARLGFSLLSM